MTPPTSPSSLPLPQPLARQVIESKHDKIYFFFGGRKYTKIVFQTRRVMHAKLSQIIFKKIKLNSRWSRRGCVWECTALGWTVRCPVKGKKVSRRRKEQQMKRRFAWHQIHTLYIPQYILFTLTLPAYIPLLLAHSIAGIAQQCFSAHNDNTK